MLLRISTIAAVAAALSVAVPLATARDTLVVAAANLDGTWMIIRKGGNCSYDIPLIEVVVSGTRLSCWHHRCGNTKGSVSANGSFRMTRSYLSEKITWSGSLVTKKGSWKRTGGEGKNCNGYLRIIKKK